LTMRGLRRLLGWSVSIGLSAVLSGCISAPTDGPDSSRRKFPLKELETTTVTIGENAFRVWLATTQEQRREGLMFVSDEEIADDQGMLFVFQREQYLSFWMRNTFISLDIAFARADGTIVTIHTMPPLTLRTFPSIEPAMFALEVKAGTFERLNIREGDRIEIPESVFKP
jgi:uncharacterized membrane protein (UPF0127 family)